MKISIITITYNSEKTIKDTINSVLSQNYKNIEYIVVDGDSQDYTKEIVNSYGNKISKFISEPDNGIYDAMNKGLKLCTGDIIGILNSDDVFFDNKVIERIVKEFEDKDVDSTFGDLYYVKQDNLDKIVRKWKSSPFIEGSFAKGWHPAHPTFYVKKEIYEKYGYFDTTFDVSADFELMLRFLEKYKITSSYIPQVLVKMRDGGESNRSIQNILLGNKNIRRAFVKNGIKVNKLYTPKRLLFKVWQRIKK